MKNTAGIILNVDGEHSNLKDLLSYRSLSTLPFGGRYRLVDFALSNLVNSDIHRIGAIGSYKYSSLVDHLGTGKEWLLSRKNQNLTILSNSTTGRLDRLLKINMRELKINQRFLENQDVDDFVIVSPNLVTNFNFSSALRIHRTNNADITLIFKKITRERNFIENDTFLDFDKYKVVSMSHQDEMVTDYYYADMLIIRRETLSDFINLFDDTGEMDLMDMIKNNLDSVKVYGAPHVGYLRRISDLQTYFNTSMELLDAEVLRALFLGDKPIYTKVKDNHPTYYTPSAQTSLSILGSGSRIEGCVENSILFREITVKKNTKISNSIIMQKAQIGENVTLDYVVLDKDVEIRDNATLIGTRNNPIILKKGTKI